jgi:(p)ppGpp synthase/HD superfamily hydrolase
MEWEDDIHVGLGMVKKCASIAEEAHRGQFRQYTNRPYIEHPMRVAFRAMLIPGVPISVICAAYLHDVYEDCQEWLNKQKVVDISTGVEKLVEWLTNKSKLEHPELNRAARKQIDRDRLSRAPYWVRVLKFLDRIDNLNEFGSAPSGFKWKYLDESRLLGEALLKNADVRDSLIDVCFGVGPLELLTDLSRELFGIIHRMEAEMEAENA